MTNLAVPVPRTFNVGETEVSAYLNAVRDALTFLTNKPICTVNQNTAQTLTTATWTSITMDATTVDSCGGHSNSVNPSRYVAQVAGWYLVAGSSVFVANATSFRMARSAKNGSAVQSSGVSYPTVSAAQHAALPVVAAFAFLNVGDYVEVQGYQNSGGNLNTTTGSPELDSGLSVIWDHA